MKKFNVNRTINYDHQLYTDTIELDAKTAAPLLANGAISKIEQPETQPEPDDLQTVIAGMDETNEQLWTKDGKPDLSMLNELLDRKVTATERDQAWETYQDANS